MIFQNGFGGFTRDGHEYVITLPPGQVTPAPWVNVMANPDFGTVVSESGGAYTWAENAHEFRLTPWHNDPVQDTTGEAFYIRDEETGQVWSPTPWPARGATPYVIRHGFGYTVFEHFEHGIVSELWVYVAMDAPVKLTNLKLRNVSGGPRRLSVTGYCEWVLGDLRHKTLLNVQTEVDLKTGALLARNFYNTEFPDRIVFLDVIDPSRTLTGNRKEFLGRNGSLAQPAALKRARLSGKVGAGLDPCGAVQVAFDLADGQERETSFRLGVGRSPGEVQDSDPTFPPRGRQRRSARWCAPILEPHPRRDQCRYARSGRERDGERLAALSDAGLPPLGPHRLLSIRRRLRFPRSIAGCDGAGARRAGSHPRAFAPRRRASIPRRRRPALVASAGRPRRAHTFLRRLSLAALRHLPLRLLASRIPACSTSRFPSSMPGPSCPRRKRITICRIAPRNPATLYEHCVRAIEHGLKFGEHGLPLIGCGDWNDGMNMVGKEGRGESVWLAFFLYDVLTQFAELARAREDIAFADRCLAQAKELQENIEANAWDGRVVSPRLLR